VKSTGCFENQPIEFHNSLTINAIFFEKELRRPFFSAKNVWNMWNSFSFVMKQCATIEDWSWIILETFFLVFEAWKRWFW